jgi:hypothetical protein
MLFLCFLPIFYVALSVSVSRACFMCDVAVVLPCLSALCVVMLLPLFHAAKTCETRVWLYMMEEVIQIFSSACLLSYHSLIFACQGVRLSFTHVLFVRMLK